MSKTPHDLRASSILGICYIGGASLFWAISATMGRAVFLGRLRLFGETVPFVSPLMLTQSRVTLAACVLFPVLWLVRGRNAVRMNLADIRDCMIVGTLGIAASNYLNYLAIQRTTVATAIIVMYQAPIVVLCWMLLRKLQKPTVARIVGVFASVTGSALAIGVVSQTVHFPWLAIIPGQMRFDLIGVGAALLAAVAFAFYNVFGRHLVKAHDSWTVLAWAVAGAAIGWIFINPPWKIIAAHYTGLQWSFMALFSTTSILIPFALYSAGLRHLDATRAIVTSCLQPVFSVVIAAVALGELVGKIQIAGILLVLASTVLVQLETQKGGNAPPCEPTE